MNLFPTLAVGLLDLKVYVVLARLNAVLNGNVFLQCPTTEYPCSAQPHSISAVPCPTADYPAEYPCSAQPQSILSAQMQSIPAVPSCRVSLQCPTTEYPCSAQPHRIPAAPKHQVFLPPSIPAVPSFPNLPGNITFLVQLEL